MAFPAASALGSIGRHRRLSFTFNSYSRQMAVTESCGCATISLATPMTWPLAGICASTHGWQVHGVRENLGGPRRV